MTPAWRRLHWQLFFRSTSSPCFIQPQVRSQFGRLKILGLSPSCENTTQTQPEVGSRAFSSIITAKRRTYRSHLREGLGSCQKIGTPGTLFVLWLECSTRRLPRAQASPRSSPHPREQGSTVAAGERISSSPFQAGPCFTWSRIPRLPSLGRGVWWLVLLAVTFS